MRPALLLVALLATGCAQQIHENFTAKATKTCTDLGYKPDSDRFLDCRLRVYQDLQNNLRADMR